MLCVMLQFVLVDLDKMSLKDYYVMEAENTLDFIRIYQKNYGLSDFELDTPTLTFEQYREERLKLCGIENEEQRMKKTALLEIGVLKHHMQSLTDIFFEMGEKYAN